MMTKKILAIDDEVDTLTFYTEALEDYDFTPITAKDGVEGLKKAREEKRSFKSQDFRGSYN